MIYIYTYAYFSLLQRLSAKRHCSTIILFSFINHPKIAIQLVVTFFLSFLLYAQYTDKAALYADYCRLSAVLYVCNVWSTTAPQSYICVISTLRHNKTYTCLRFIADSSWWSTYYVSCHCYMFLLLLLFGVCGSVRRVCNGFGVNMWEMWENLHKLCWSYYSKYCICISINCRRGSSNIAIDWFKFENFITTV